MAYKPVGGSAGGVSNGVPIGPGITFMGMGGNPLVEPGTLQPGTYQIRVKVDPDNRCVESNENNNELMVSLTIAPPPQAMAPDLVVTRATFTPPNPTTADRVTINVEMRNQGNGAATIPSGSFQWMAYKPVGGNIGGFSPGAPIPSGITFMGGNTLVEPGTLPPGTYQIRVKVDPDNRCAESNENNNELVVSLTIAQPQQAMTPDLVVTRATFTPPNPTTADRVMINVEMRNQGNGAATIPSGAPQWTADRPVGGGVGGSSNGAPIAPGIIFTAGIALVEPGSLQPGTYPIRVKVDPDNRCAESNENNNEVVVSLTITPLLPDLVISEMARMGESANVKVTVMNQGLGTANFPANSLIVGGGDLSTQYAGNQGEIFGPGVSKTYMLTKMNLQAGTFTWKTTVDPDRKLMETDENNNEKTITVTVKKDKD
jgi:subtilase family serine protease